LKYASPKLPKKTCRRLLSKTQASILEKIKGSKKIPLFRLRIGSYRVIYYVKESTAFILVVVNKREFEKELKVLVKALNKHTIEEN